MTTKLKLYLGRKVMESLKKAPNIAPTQLNHLIQIGAHRSKNSIVMNMPLKALESRLGGSSINEILKIQPDDIILGIHCGKEQINRKVSFEINRNIFVKDVVENCTTPEVNFDPKKIIVEYSSPNIAKPFHVGHIRSTIIGNFIANLHNYLQDNVVKLNYLGDWGTQFGLIQVGVDKLNYSNDDIKQDPIKLLYESYVYANQLAEKDPEINELARQKFSELERDGTNLENWRTYIDYTVDELEKIYGRLGVKFDEYSYESMYNAKDIKNVLNLLKQKAILQEETDGRQTATLDNRKVSVIKSDGTTLYLARDIAAAIDRFDKYKFDRMFYVAENGQHDHFQALQKILFKVKFPWAKSIEHVKFGRIRGMSTRKGKVVFLKDILDESKELMIKKQLESPNTKVPITDEITSDILGVSCVVVNDLKQRRLKDYEFNWDKALQANGDTGIRLQYTHCRLCSLERNCGAIANKICQPELIEQPEVTILVSELARFPDVLHDAKEQLEACILVSYLFHLCNHINRAFKVLQVKDQDPQVAGQRLLLFNTARDILSQGMSILGLKPLTRM